MVTNACRGSFNTRQGDTAFKQEQATAAHNVDDSHTQNVEWKKPGRRAHAAQIQLHKAEDWQNECGEISQNGGYLWGNWWEEMQASY